VKTAVVDIDNTLFDFASELYKRIVPVCANFPIPPQDWIHWDFWSLFVDKKTFFKAVREVHLDQDKFEPYPDAADFLVSLKECGFNIVIASHRDRNALHATEIFLRKHGLTYDSVYLSHNKTVLFGACDLVVDDCPAILDAAKQRGITAVGLEFPWNRDSDHALFQRLTDIKEAVLCANHMS
jgi:FMN phosphatase YigB (HAD superfamily)